MSTWRTCSGLEAKVKLSVILSASTFTFFMKVNCFIKGFRQVRNVPSLQIINVGYICKKKETCWDFVTEAEILFHWSPGLENFACVQEIHMFLPGYFLLIHSRVSDKMENTVFRDTAIIHFPVNTWEELFLILYIKFRSYFLHTKISAFKVTFPLTQKSQKTNKERTIDKF